MLMYGNWQCVDSLPSKPKTEIFICNTKGDPNTYVMKKVEKDSVSEMIYRNEVEIMKIISHPKIVKLKENFETEDSIIIIMEYLGDTDLLSFLLENGRCHELLAKKIFLQILEIIYYLHSQGIVHGDIKAENIIINTETYECKLIDFGMSTKNGSELRKGFLGTPIYMAPELLDKNFENTNHYKSDIWSLGVLLYAILHNFYPFDAENITKQNYHKKLMKCQYIKYRGISQEAYDLLGKLINTNPSERISLEEIFDHQWFKTENPIGSPRERKISQDSHSNSNAEDNVP